MNYASCNVIIAQKFQKQRCRAPPQHWIEKEDKSISLNPRHQIKKQENSMNQKCPQRRPIKYSANHIHHNTPNRYERKSLIPSANPDLENIGCSPCALPVFSTCCKQIHAIKTWLEKVTVVISNKYLSQDTVYYKFYYSEINTSWIGISIIGWKSANWQG